MIQPLSLSHQLWVQKYALYIFFDPFIFVTCIFQLINEYTLRNNLMGLMKCTRLASKILYCKEVNYGQYCHFILLYY